MALISPSQPPTDSGPGGARLAILASGNGSNFAAIEAAVARGALDVEICGLVYNNPDAYVAERAREHGIAATLVDHRQFGSRTEHDAAVVEALRGFGAEWVVMAGWMRIATDVLLAAFPDRILNIHPSLLPAFRGLHAVEQAIDAGVKISGCTVHIVRPAVDDGPIIAQAAVAVEPDDDAARLHERIHIAEHELYPRAIALAIRGAR